MDIIHLNKPPIKEVIIGISAKNLFTSTKEILDFIEQKNLELLNVDISESKISITFKNIIEDTNLQELHKRIF